jgi:hypothetical protein
MLEINSAVSEIIQKHYRALNNRNSGRYWVGKGVYTLMSWKELHAHFLLGQMIDTSDEGCGICYVVERSTADAFRLQKAFSLRIFGAFKMFDLKNNTVVHDNELVQYSTARISARRCGIKFGKVSE